MLLMKTRHHGTIHNRSCDRRPRHENGHVHQRNILVAFYTVDSADAYAKPADSNHSRILLIADLGDSSWRQIVAFPGDHPLSTCTPRRWRSTHNHLHCPHFVEQAVSRLDTVRSLRAGRQVRYSLQSSIALLWASGGILYLAQLAGLAIAREFAPWDIIVSCLFAIFISLHAFPAIARCNPSSNVDLLALAGDEGDNLEEQYSLLAKYITPGHRHSPTSTYFSLARSQILNITAVSMFFMGVGDAATPLFSAYVMHRYGFRLSQVGNYLDSSLAQSIC